MDARDNPKARNLKHLKNKKKYNKKSTAHTAVSKPKPVTLDSNWDRYDQENEQTINPGTDFLILANAPITQGSHFQFKSDKVLAEEDNVTPLELFKLDLNLLEKSISTIPFSTRCGIDDKYFTEEQHRVMKATAKNNSEKYVAYLQTLSDTVNIGDLVFYSDGETDKAGYSESDDLLDNVDDVIIVKEKEKGELEVTVETQNESNENDLEQWLDTILDD